MAQEEKPPSKPKSFWPSGLRLPERIVIVSGFIALCVAWYFIFSYTFFHPAFGLFVAIAALFGLTVCVLILIYIIQGIRNNRARRK